VQTAFVWQRFKDRLKGGEPIADAPLVWPGFELAVQLGAFAEQLGTLPPGKWRSVEDQVRRRSCEDPVGLEGWLTIRANDVDALCAVGPDPLLTCALLCMHPSGYVRQTALDGLAKAGSLERVLPILILRSSDWVSEVREVAISSLDRLRRELPTKIFLPSLALMADEDTVVSSRRSYAAGLGRWLIDSFDDDALLAMLRSSDAHARRRAAQALVQRGGAAFAFRAAVRQSDVVVARNVADGLTPDEWSADGIVDSALNSKFSGLRAVAFIRLQSSDPARAAAVSNSFIASSSRTLRFLAQRYCSDNAIDSAAIYRNLLSSNSAIALTGLGEVGSPDDVTLVRPYLASLEGNLRRRAVTAIARLGGRNVEAEVAARLGDTAAGVARSASDALRRLGPVPATIDTAWEFSEQLTHDGVRNATFRLFRAQGRWMLLRIACRSVTSTDADLRERGVLLIEQCIREWNRSFMSPTSVDAAELREVLPHAMATLPRDIAELVGLSVQPHLGSAYL
jgi:HEAT repeat protein